MLYFKRITILIIIVLSIFEFSVAQDCKECHQSIKTNCGQTCNSCHLDSRAEFFPTEEHQPVVANPSDPEWWERKCGSCHPEHINSIKNSLHFTYAGIISQTRYLWGKDSLLNLDMPSDAWQELALENAVSSKKHAHLVDNLLAKKCMNCHIDVDNREGLAGRIRVSGCAACHTAFEQETGMVQFGHKFNKRPKDSNCLSCHNSNYVGGDYYGYFEHDYHKEYHTPAFSKPYFGAFQHHLQSDVHKKNGMPCVDCHSHEHRKNDQKKNRFEGEHTLVKCEDCHGGFRQKEVKKSAVPVFNSKSVAHQNFHEQVTCTACHSQWSYQDYGMHLFLDESNNYQMWEPYAWQGDKQVLNLLHQQMNLDQLHPSPAYSKNALSEIKSPGIWYKAWTLRRWENPVLGIDTHGKYSVIRPLYQYFITYVDSSDNLWIDSVEPKRQDGKLGWNWDAYVPHTIGKQGRNCESCHGNAKAAGLGIRQSIQDSVAHTITLPSPPILPGSRLLNSEEQSRLLKKSTEYKKWRAIDFRRKGIEKMLYTNESGN